MARVAWGLATPLSIFKKLRKLRVLIVALSRQDDELIQEPSELSVSKNIGQLKHLRYFAFRATIGCNITLPSSITKLYNIEALDFGSSRWELPNIGRMISLGMMRDFTVRNEEGHEVMQLRDLNKLCGTLRINGLENVKSEKEAAEANLAVKELLRNLTLSWSDGGTRCTHEVEAQVLEGLRPPMGLETLSIFHYQGSMYPDWMVGNYPMNIHKLWFDGWTQTVPPPELKAFPHLRSLDLWRCSWTALPPSMMNLTSLKRLLIFNCLKIQSLPVLPGSLEVFILINCNHELMKSCQTDGHENWQKIERVHEKIIIADPRGKSISRLLHSFPFLYLSRNLDSATSTSVTNPAYMSLSIWESVE
jgi:hypothetical protein